MIDKTIKESVFCIYPVNPVHPVKSLIVACFLFSVHGELFSGFGVYWISPFLMLFNNLE